ncbi:hypothetical protein CLOM_g13723 [Closterium sp. NIES-68]|nr:hypothetical protein CLOM_g13723 [Closterium sp. NIES-68]
MPQPPPPPPRFRRPPSLPPALLALLAGLLVVSSLAVGRATDWTPPDASRISHHGESHGSRASLDIPSPTQRRTSLLEAAPSRPPAAGPILDGSQLCALLDLNAAWHLWPTNSNRSRRCDQWDYIQCTRQGFIVSIDLSLGAVNATMPLTIFSRMPQLRRLVLSDNLLSGSITHLSLPSSLRVLDLSHTSISGALPLTLSALPALSYLDVSATSISDSLPSTLSRLSLLTYLNVGAWNITGRVEDLSWLSSLTNLHTLHALLQLNLLCWMALAL